MTATDRREFLRRAGLSTAGLAALAGPLQGVFARGALAADATGVSANNGGYGPIGPVRDQADGVVRLHLPEWFKYRSFSAGGTLTTDGIITPGRHDGMAAFAGHGGKYRQRRSKRLGLIAHQRGQRRAISAISGCPTTRSASSSSASRSRRHHSDSSSSDAHGSASSAL